MTAKITIDGAGRVVIPKAVRDGLDLEPGDTLQLEADGQSITLKPARAAVSMMKKKGIWVLNTGEKIKASVTDDLLAEIRTERGLRNAGFKD